MSSGSGSHGDNARDQQQLLLHSFSRRFSLVIVAMTVFSGCGSSEKRLPVFPISGKVTFEGKPPVGALVALSPVGQSESLDLIPTGTVKEDGSFTITAYDPDDGAPQGEYVATIQWYKVTKELGGPGPNVLPAKYSSASTSPIKVTVKEGPTEIPPITIAKN